MRYLIVFLFLILLLGCQTVKEKTSAMENSFNALGSGDIAFLEKYKKNKNDDESWKEVE